MVPSWEGQAEMTTRARGRHVSSFGKDDSAAPPRDEFSGFPWGKSNLIEGVQDLPREPFPIKNKRPPKTAERGSAADHGAW